MTKTKIFGVWILEFGVYLPAVQSALWQAGLEFGAWSLGF